MRSCPHLTALMACCFLVGCGGGIKTPTTAPVSGKVTYLDKPLEGAEITFMTEGAPRGAHGITDAEGKFKLSTFGKNDGAILGKHRVTIRKFQLPEFAKAKYKDSSAIQKAKREAEAAGLPTEPTPLIPIRYSMADQSGLTAEVKSGNENVFTFNCTL